MYGELQLPITESPPPADWPDSRDSTSAPWPTPCHSMQRPPGPPWKSVRSGAGSSQMNSSTNRATWPLPGNGSATTAPVPTTAPSRSNSLTCSVFSSASGFITPTPVRTTRSPERVSAGARNPASGSLLSTRATPWPSPPPSNRTTPLSGPSGRSCRWRNWTPP